MKIQNNKTKTTIVISALILGMIMISPMTIMPNVNAVNNTQKPDDVLFIEQHMPQKLANSDLITLKQLVISNNNVKKIINGNNYEFMTQDFVGDMKNQPGVMYPQIHINVANKTEVTVQADLKAGTILSIVTLLLLN